MPPPAGLDGLELLQRQGDAADPGQTQDPHLGAVLAVVFHFHTRAMAAMLIMQQLLHLLEPHVYTASTMQLMNEKGSLCVVVF